MKLCLLTDVPLHEASLGISRTLYNLLRDLPETRLSVCTCSHTEVEERGAFSKTTHFFFKNHLLPPFLPFHDVLNRTFLSLTPASCLQELQAQSFDLALVCFQSMEGGIGIAKILRKLQIPYILYWMDDLKDHEKERWLFNTGFHLFQELSCQAAGLAAVSERLLHSLSSRYGAHGKPTLIIHNPVDRLSPEPKKSPSNPFRLVYAGSLWPMHLDGFLLIAHRINALAAAGKPIECILHTPKSFWLPIQQEISGPGLRYGGELSYTECLQAMTACDMGLVTASFLPQYAHLTSSSLQTKLTDYLAAGLPLLSFGPSEAVAHEFVRRWDCGLALSSSRAEDIDGELCSLLHNPNSTFPTFSREHIFDIVDTHFSRPVVQKKFLEFCKLCLRAP